MEVLQANFLPLQNFVIIATLSSPLSHIKGIMKLLVCIFPATQLALIWHLQKYDILSDGRKVTTDHMRCLMWPLLQQPWKVI